MKNILTSKKFWVILSVCFVLGAIVFWQRKNLFAPQLKNPLESRDPTVILSQNLEKAGLNTPHLTVIDGETIAASISGFSVFFSSAKDFSQQVQALQLILSRRTIDKAPKEIDLRFNNVVTRY